MIGLQDVTGTDTRADDGRATDNSIKWFAVKYGPWAALAFYLVWQLTGNISRGVEAMNTNLNTHISEQRYYLGAICYMTAKQTGESPNICQPGVPAQMPGTANKVR